MNWFKDKFEYLSSVKWGAYGIGISFLKQLCLLPAFLYAVGDYYYSLWIYLTAVSVLIGSVSLGHFHYASNYFNLAHHNGEDVSLVYRKLNASNLIYIGIQFLAIAFLLIPPDSVLFQGFSSEVITANHAVFCLVALSLSKVLMLFSGMFLSRLLEPLGRVRQTLKMQALVDLVDFVVTVAVILLTRNLLITCVAVAVASIVFFALVFLYVQRSFQFSLFSIDVSVKEGGLFIKESLLLNVSFFLERVYDQGIHLIVLYMFSANVLPVFNSTRTVSNVFFRFSLIAILPLFPGIQRYYALQDYDYVVRIFKKFWVISAVIIICFMIVGYPLLPYVYKLWTKGKIEYDETLMGALFMGVLFQNFASVGYEFFKKLNYSLDILLLNVLRILSMCVCMYAFGRVNYLPGIGFSFFIAELMCSLCSVFFLTRTFKSYLVVRECMVAMLPFLVFSCFMGMFISCQNYLWLITGAVISLVMTYRNFNTISKL